MKTFCLALLLLSFSPALIAQQAPVNPNDAVVTTRQYSREELKQLVGSIALYPDPLVGLILPASTFPSDIVLAARFVETGEDLSLVDQKPWDVSVRALTRYPDVLKWMDENLEWTTQLGHAYLAQPNDVMDAIQELRGKAQQVGNLVDTPQQKIVREEQYIRIVPADPEYIYAPYYDPMQVYYERPVGFPYMTFGPRWLTGWWLSFDFDWRRHHLYCGDWDGGWDYGHHHDRYDHYGERVYINENLSNYQLWEGDRGRRLASARTFADVGTRQQLARPNRFREQPALASKVQRSLLKNEDRWAKRAVSSGLAKNSLADKSGRRGKGGKDLLDSTQSDAAAVTDPLAGKGRKDGIEKDAIQDKDAKDRFAMPKGDAPRLSDALVGKGRRDADAKGAAEDKGAKGGKDRLVTPKGDAPSVANADIGKGRKGIDAKGVIEEKSAKGGKDRLVTPKGDAPSVANADIGKGRSDTGAKGVAENKGAKDPLAMPKSDAPGVAAKGGGKADMKGRSDAGSPITKARDDTKGKGPITTQKPPGSVSKAPSVKGGGTDLKRSAGSVTQSGPSKPVSRPSVQKSSSKPKAMASATKRPPKSSGPSVRQSSPKPRLAASKPMSSPKRSANLAANRSPSKSKASAPSHKPQMKLSSPKPQQVKASAPKSSGGGGGQKASSNTSDKKKKKK